MHFSRSVAKLICRAFFFGCAFPVVRRCFWGIRVPFMQLTAGCFLQLSRMFHSYACNTETTNVHFLHELHSLTYHTAALLFSHVLETHIRVQQSLITSSTRFVVNDAFHPLMLHSYITNLLDFITLLTFFIMVMFHGRFNGPKLSRHGLRPLLLPSTVAHSI